MGEVCKNAIEHVRFPLIDPDELSFIDKENERKRYIPVSFQIFFFWGVEARACLNYCQQE